MAKKHRDADRRKAEILAAAVKLSERNGYMLITRDAVAATAGCAQGCVSLYFSTMHNLRRAVVGEAIATNNMTILGQALVARDSRVVRLPDTTKRAIIAAL